MPSEAAIQQQVRLALSNAGAVMHRNNSGAYQDKAGRLIRYGVGSPGGSDLVGWTPVTVTADMVGQTLAVFTACEVKTATGRPTPHQLNFIAQVLRAGGFAGIARSSSDALQIIRK